MNIIAYGTVEVRLIHEVSEAVVVKKTQEGAEIELGFDRDIGADQPARVGGLSRHTEVSHCWPNLAKSQNGLEHNKTGMLAKGVQCRPQNYVTDQKATRVASLPFSSSTSRILNFN